MTTACKQASSHSGLWEDFEVFWRTGWRAWYIGLPNKYGKLVGPFETSQAAFCAMVEAIDKENTK